MKKITLPNNIFGISVFLCILFLIASVPFVFSFWLIGLIAPWWIAFPTSLLISILTFFKFYKFEKRQA